MGSLNQELVATDDATDGSGLSDGVSDRLIILRRTLEGGGFEDESRG
jgi:hypothetical protein